MVHEIKMEIGNLAAVIHEAGNDFIICNHGLYSNKDSRKYIEMAMLAEKNGMSCVRFDFTGCGESKGDFNDSVLTRRIEDLSKVVEYVEKNYGGRIALFGSSYGGMTAMVYASMHGVKPVAVMSTPYEIHGIGRFSEDASRYDMLEHAARIEQLLVMHGFKDELVPVEHAFRIYESGKEPKKLVLFNTDHSFSHDIEREKALNESMNWFRKHLHI
ncbi:MAG: alpha/beta fold hydrolase [Thermoplasmata archaeon]|nr:alpha/beta fold hydrolase [Thermoplasmata archaeon]